MFPNELKVGSRLNDWKKLPRPGVVSVSALSLDPVISVLSEFDPAARDRVESGQAVQQHRLARNGRIHDLGEATSVGVRVDVVERQDPSLPPL